MNQHVQGLHEAHEDERTRHVRAVKTEQKEREARELARRRISTLVDPDPQDIAVGEGW